MNEKNRDQKLNYLLKLTLEYIRKYAEYSFREKLQISLKHILYKYKERTLNIVRSKCYLYNNYSETRNLISRDPCRIRQSCTATVVGKFETFSLFRVYDVVRGLKMTTKDIFTSELDKK